MLDGINIKSFDRWLILVLEFFTIAVVVFLSVWLVVFIIHTLIFCESLKETGGAWFIWRIKEWYVRMPFGWCSSYWSD
jgi:hypothetical protein